MLSAAGVEITGPFPAITAPGDVRSTVRRRIAKCLIFLDVTFGAVTHTRYPEKTERGLAQ
jgi:hypothetical protein